MEPPAPGHVPVLLPEVLDLLRPAPGGVLLDATLGRTGHARALAPRLAPGGTYIGLDADPGNVADARAVLADIPVTLHLVHGNFARARAALDALGIERVDGVLADLGFASTQMDDPARGFSFRGEGPLDMRLDPSREGTAADLVNALPERELADLIFRYGEERLSRKIARKIVERRERAPILTTSGLAEVVRAAYGVPPIPDAEAPSSPRLSDSHQPRAFRGSRSFRGRIDPATRTFMALRIAVNDELGALERLLEALPALLKPGGRAAIISFHSLEDRRVKHAFADFHRWGLARRLTPKPLVAGEAERDANPRSRSAKLRGIEWIGEDGDGGLNPAGTDADPGESAPPQGRKRWHARRKSDSWSGSG